MFVIAHVPRTKPRFNSPSERRSITFSLSDTQDPYPHWTRGQNPDGPPLRFEPRTFGMVGAHITAEPRAPRLILHGIWNSFQRNEVKVDTKR